MHTLLMKSVLTLQRVSKEQSKKELKSGLLKKQRLLSPIPLKFEVSKLVLISSS